MLVLAGDQLTKRVLHARGLLAKMDAAKRVDVSDIHVNVGLIPRQNPISLQGAHALAAWCPNPDSPEMACLRGINGRLRSVENHARAGAGASICGSGGAPAPFGLLRRR